MIECQEKVAVLMPTYNHKEYIARAVNSVLMQRTDFDFTLWIVDDCSTDGTSEIIKDIIKSNQNKRVTIKHVISETNLGIHNKIVHFDNILTSEALKNQYVALCSGDDYWISDVKLQQQYDILRLNKDSMGIGDSFICIKNDGIFLNQHRGIILKKNKALLDPFNPYSQGSTIMFKNIVDWEYFPDILHDDGGLLKIFNWYGDIIFREIATTVYHKVPSGMSATAILTVTDMPQQLNYLVYLVVRIIHYLKTNENLLLEKDHNFIMTKVNKEWKFIAHYFIDDKILDFVEQYKTKRNHDKIPHYTSEMTFGTRPSYKIVL